MKLIVYEHFQAELDKGKISIAKQDFESAWIALQRAHILGQEDAARVRALVEPLAKSAAS